MVIYLLVIHLLMLNGTDLTQHCCNIK